MSRRAVRRVPTVIVAEASECTLGALAMMLRWHGRDVTLPELRDVAGQGAQGTLPEGVKRIAAHFGFRARFFRREPETLAQLSFPCLVNMNFNHMVVVEGVDGGGFLVNDPSSGPRLMTGPEFDRAFTGIAAILEPLDAPRPRPLRHTPSAGPGLAAIMAPLAATAVAAMAGAATAEVAAVRTGAPLYLLAAVAALAAAALVLRSLRRRLVERLGAWVEERLAAKSPRFFANRQAARLHAYATVPQSAADLLTGWPAERLLWLLASPVPMAALAMDAPAAGGLVAIALAVLIATALPALRRGGTLRRALLSGQSRAGLGVGDLTTLETVQVAGRDEDTLALLTGAAARAVEPERAVAWTQTWSMAVATGTAAGTITAVAWLTADEGALQPVALAALAVVPWLGLSHLLPSLIGLQNLKACIDDLRDHDPSPQPPAPAAAGAIRLRQVTFTYGHALEAAVAGLDVDVSPGEVLGLTGPLGSGKTTVTHLMAGLLAPTAGVVEVGGPVLAVSAQPVLFAGTVAENITLWDADIPARAVIEALRTAELWPDVEARGGLAAIVTEDGANWSGGQQRRMILARALVRRPRILVLDETLDGLDGDTEAAILANLRRAGMTVILASQRQCSLARCDSTLCLGEETVAERPDGGAAAPQAPASPLEACPAASADLARSGLEALLAAAGDLGAATAPVGVGPGMTLRTAARAAGLYLRPVSVTLPPLPEVAAVPLLLRHGSTWRYVPAGRRVPAHGADEGFAAYRRGQAPAVSHARDATLLAASLLAGWGGWLCAGWAITLADPVAAAASVIAVGLGHLGASHVGLGWRQRLGLAADAAVWGAVLRLPAAEVRRRGVGEIAAAAGAATNLMRSRRPAAVAVVALIGVLAAGLATVATAALELAALLAVACLAVAGLRVAIDRRTVDLSNATDGARVAAGRFLMQVIRDVPGLQRLAGDDALLHRWRLLRRPVEDGIAQTLLWRHADRAMGRLAPLGAALAVGAAAPGAPQAAMAAAVVCVAAATLASEVTHLLDAKARRRIAAALGGPTEAEGAQPAPERMAVTMSDVWFAYPDAPDSPVLRGADLTLAPGEVVALMAPTGAGKTTLLRILLGFEHPQHGRVIVGGVDLAQADRMAVRDRCAAVLQDQALPLRMLYTHLAGQGTGVTVQARAWTAAQLGGLLRDGRIGRMDLLKPVSSETFSPGQCSQVLLGRALLTTPDILILDEALAALPETARAAAFATIRQAASACLVVTHDDTVAARCDRVLRLADGRIHATPPRPATAGGGGAVPTPLPAAPPLFRRNAADHADGGMMLDLVPPLRPLPAAVGAAAPAALLLGVLACLM